ncbi:MAG: VTC domain-containing protein [candidate division KSB1 bacterium]|nr:VTC domain-containing protein [candidate division KSB1 bacterium]MDZ7303594.1 VTC domain-containing protein [candidate division KSB1 bacterium]MDZ7312837.1 VTC domain-containing protein [candidate division KSB1 bacterium]
MAKPVDKIEKYRYERKFLVSELTKHEIESIVRLHPAMFIEAYPPRFVNNVYFDSSALANYFENADGIMNRTKVRIRWYGDLLGFIEKPVLEFKIKKGLLGRKVSFPLPALSVDLNFQRETITEVLNKAEIPDAIKLDLLSWEPALLNRYRRKYFQSADHDYRITIDSDMEFYMINARNNTFLHKSADVVRTIVELKYDPDKDGGAEAITNFFPFRLSKNSKYADGIERLYYW